MTAFEKYLIEAFGETWERSGIMEAHNAALAAQAYQHGLLHAETLQQLAAERALIEAERKHNESTIVELEQQIAAERSLAKVKQ